MEMALKKIVALVPMRHHSQRVPRKNFREIAGKPLYHYILETLSGCAEISEIVVDTDSPVIIEGLEKHFPEVRILARPEHLCADTISMNEILMYDTSQVEADLYLQTHTTNPLLKSETVSSAINLLVANYPAYDSLFSCTRLQTRLWDPLGRAINHNPNILIQTQDLPPIYEENSCIYIFTKENLEQRRNRLGFRPYLFEMDAAEAVDIDEKFDFQLAELMLSARSNS
jgi:CMP-N-acetylneuraminic acid synthetase